MGHRHRDLAILVAAWCAAMWLVGLGGAFPLNDDWSYAIAVQRLLDEGTFRPTDWTSMPLLSQALWGALFCLPGGFSHEALRLSTAVLGLLGVVTTWLLLREVGAGRTASLLGAGLVGGNPVWFGLSVTFMTDVPFATWSTLALLLYLRSLRRRRRALALAGTLAMAAAVLDRQLGLFVGVAYAAGLLRRDGLRAGVWLRAALPLLLGIALLAGFAAWLDARGVLPSEYTVKSRGLLAVLHTPLDALRNVAHGGFVGSLYLGCFLLPLLALPAAEPAPRWARRAGIAWALVAGALLLLRGKMMPLGINVLTPAGIGPDALRDVYLLELPNRAPLPGPFWLVVTALAVVGAGLLLARLGAAVAAAARPPSDGAGDEPVTRSFLLAGAAAYVAPIAVQMYLDRYLVVLLPVLAALLAVGNRRAVVRPPHRLGAALALAPLLLLAVGGTHDWLERSRARWRALGWLEQQGVDARRIDGGFEFHGLRTFDLDHRPPPERSWWWVHDDEYVVAMGPMPGYREVGRFPVARWLPPRDEAILVLRR